MATLNRNDLENSLTTTADHGSDENVPLSGTKQKSYGTPGDTVGDVARSKRVTDQRFWCFVLFLTLSVLGVAIAVCVYLNTDDKGLRFTPRVLNCYVSILIVIYVLWLIADQVSSRYENLAQKRGKPVMPTHLLNGLVLFGVGDAFCQAVTIVDFFKCARHVPSIDNSSVVYAFFEIAFVFCQIYMFYEFSSKRNRHFLFFHALVMFTLAINCTIWASYLITSAIHSKQLSNIAWFSRYYYGVEGNDTCFGPAVGDNSRSLHAVRAKLVPITYTLAMEYSLLAFALLLHLWFWPDNVESDTGATKINLWRAQFVFGLFLLPFFATILSYGVSLSTDRSRIVVVIVELLYQTIFIGNAYLYSRKLNNPSIFEDDTSSLKLDVTLMAVTWAAFLTVDFFTMLASVARVFVHFEWNAFIMGLQAFFELLATGSISFFLWKANAKKPKVSAVSNEDKKEFAQLRQMCSFCAVLSFGFYAMKVYMFRSHDTYITVSELFYGEIAWFIINLLCSPLCAFFYFHCAVCYTEVLAKVSLKSMTAT